MANRELILLDVETQRDFFVPGGACYTSQAEPVRANVYSLIEWAKQAKCPVLSTVLRVGAHQVGPMADVPHCVEDTTGEKKLTRTVLRSHIDLGMRNTTDLPGDLLGSYQQVIFEKRDVDIFQHHRAERLLSELPETTFVICGAGISCGIVSAAIGLRTRGFPVVLATDASLAIDPLRSPMAYRRMHAKGVLFVRTQDIIAPPQKPDHLTRFRTAKQVDVETLV